MESKQPYRKLLLLLSFIVLSSYCFSQVTEQWVRRYSGPLSDVDVATVLAVDALCKMMVVK